MGLYQSVAIEEGYFASLQDGLLLLIAHLWHEPQGHSPSLQLLGVTVAAVEVGRIVAGVGVSQGTALWVEDGVEAGDEHVLRDACQQCLVDLREYLPGRGGAQGLSGYLQHAAGGRHHKRCRYALTGSIPHHEAQPTLREQMEVVEVAPNLPSWLVAWRDHPTLQGGHLLGQGGFLDASGHPKLLGDTLAHQSELVEKVPGLHHLALLGEAEDGDCLEFHLLAGGGHVPKLSLVGTPKRYAVHYLVPFRDLLVDADAPVGEGRAILLGEALYVLGAALEGRAV